MALRMGPYCRTHDEEHRKRDRHHERTQPVDHKARSCCSRQVTQHLRHRPPVASVLVSYSSLREHSFQVIAPSGRRAHLLIGDELRNHGAEGSLRRL